MWRHLNGEKLTRLFTGRSTEDEYWADVIGEGQYPPDLDGTPTYMFLADAMRRNFREIEGTASIVRALNGYDLVLLSDHARE